MSTPYWLGLLALPPKDIFQTNAKYAAYSERTFQRRRVPPLLNRNHGLTRNADLLCERRLTEAAMLLSQLFNFVRYRRSFRHKLDAPAEQSDPRGILANLR